MQIKGKVTDSQGEPLAMANVTIITGDRANKLGTIVDLNGNFILDDQAITPESIFRISYLGYSPKDIKAGDLLNNTEPIVLLETAEQLSGVTVIGKPKTKTITDTKQQFISHLRDHKYVYASAGGILGLILITMSIKKITLFK